MTTGVLKTMTKYSKNQPLVSKETQEEAINIARGTQRPGQTKEQTKLIAQGIQKGIDQYKKQQKAKARELDRKHKKLSQQQNHSPPTIEIKETIIFKHHWLPWGLLVLSWLGMAIYLFLKE